MRGSSNKKKINLKNFNARNPKGQQLISEAMENGIIVRFDALEFPIWLNPSAFMGDLLPPQAQRQVKNKGGKNLDMSRLMRQNNRSKKPNKASLKKEMRKTIQNMTLTYYLLNSRGHITNPQNKAWVYMRPNVEDAQKFYTLWNKSFEEQMAKYDKDQKDAALGKAYAQAVLDLAPYDSNMSKKLNANNGKLKKAFDAIASIDISKIKSEKKTTGKKDSKPKGKSKSESQGADTTPLSDRKIRTFAKEYAASPRGAYSKFKARYGVRNADKIKKMSLVYKETQNKQVKPKSKPKSKPKNKK